MRVLVLISDVPYPPITGSRQRNFHLWPLIQKMGVELKVLGTSNTIVTAADRSVYWREVDANFYPYDRYSRYLLAKKLLYLSLYSYHQFPQSSLLLQQTDRMINDWRPDLVHVEELRMAKYLPSSLALKGAKGIRTCITLHNVESTLIKETGSCAVPFLRYLIEPIHRLTLARYEKQALSNINQHLAYSVDDMKQYQLLYPYFDWDCTSNGANVRGISPTIISDPKSVLWVGALNYWPNIEGLFWFLDQIFPLLRQDITITVAGSRADKAVKDKLQNKRIRFIDSPDDLQTLYRSHAMCIVPLLSGSGTRTKILEALAYQRLVITTSTGLQGLEIEEGEGVILADNAQTFADKINQWAQKNVDQFQEICLRGRTVVERKYDWRMVAQDLVNKWQKIITSYD